MKKLFSHVAIAALALSVANATPSITDGAANTIKTKLEVKAVTTVGLRAIVDADINNQNKFVGAMIDLGKLSPNEVKTFASAKLPFYIRSNIASGDVKISVKSASGIAELTHETNAEAKIPVIYKIHTIDGADEMLDMSNDTDELVIAHSTTPNLDGLTALDSDFIIQADTNKITNNSLAGHYSQELAVTITAS